MAAPMGAVNAWKCLSCGKLTVAIHVDEGVTPMFLGCRSCGTGSAVSAGYPPPPIPLNVFSVCRWEWAKASRTQMKRWRHDDPAMYQHCQAGGLVLRPISDIGRQLLDEAVARG